MRKGGADSPPAPVPQTPQTLLRHTTGRTANPMRRPSDNSTL